MSRKLRPLYADDLDRLPPGCSDCAFWESAGERERRCGAVCDVDTQRAWYRRVTDEWGSCGRVAFEDDEVLGFVKYAPSGYFPQSATFSAAPQDPSIPMLACLHIVPDALHRGLARTDRTATHKIPLETSDSRNREFDFLLFPRSAGREMTL